jgi:hypothetical protein
VGVQTGSLAVAIGVRHPNATLIHAINAAIDRLSTDRTIARALSPWHYLRDKLERCDTITGKEQPRAIRSERA